MSVALVRQAGSTSPGQRLRALFLGRPSARMRQHDALDGLRGLAVLIVLASHMSNMGQPLLPGVNLSGTGKSGVYLFFVLSAFLLTRALIEWAPGDFARARPWANYLLRRVVRIWPLYLVVLLLSWALTVTAASGWHYVIDTPALFRHLALVEGRSVLWSIPVEFKFYAWLPGIAFGIAWMAHRGSAWWMELAAFLALTALAMAVWPPEAAAVNDPALGPYLVVFLCGCFAARIDQRVSARGTRWPRAGWGAVAGGVAVMVVATVPSIWARLAGAAFDPAFNHRWFAFFGVVWSLLLLAVLHGPTALNRAFCWAPLRTVGIVSFSLYLWHMPTLEILRGLGWHTAPLGTALLVAAVLLVSGLSFLVFERPWRDVHWPRSMQPVTAPAPVPSRELGSLDAGGAAGSRPLTDRDR